MVEDGKADGIEAVDTFVRQEDTASLERECDGIFGGEASRERILRVVLGKHAPKDATQSSVLSTRLQFETKQPLTTEQFYALLHLADAQQHAELREAITYLAYIAGDANALDALAISGDPTAKFMRGPGAKKLREFAGAEEKTA